MDRLKPLGPGLWVASFPSFSVAGVRLGTRSTVIALDQGLAIISPGPFGPETLEEIKALGPVKALVAPNLMHHLFMAPAVEAFPEARVLLAPGLAQKRPDLPCHGTLPAELPGLDQVFLEGMPRLNETAFFHRASKTLILTDLAFNFGSHPHLPTRWALKLNRAHRRFGPSRLLRHFFLQTGAQLKHGLERVLEWNFERVVVAHGEVLERDGPSALRRGYSWLLGPVPSR